MKKTIKLSLATVILVGAMSSCSDSPENITTAKAYMYNVVVDESNLDAPATLTQDWSSFVINFGSGNFSGDIKASNGSMSVSFSTGNMDMTVGDRSFVFSKGAIAAGSHDVTNLKGMYDNRTGALNIDFMVDGKLHVYSADSYAYNFCNAKVETKQLTGVRFMLIPDRDTKKMSVIITNFRKTVDSYPVTVSYDDIDFSIAHNGDITGKSDHCNATDKNATLAAEYGVTNLLAVAHPVTGKGLLMFNMDGRSYEIEGDVFSPATKDTK